MFEYSELSKLTISELIKYRDQLKKVEFSPTSLSQHTAYKQNLAELDHSDFKNLDRQIESFSNKVQKDLASNDPFARNTEVTMKEFGQRKDIGLRVEEEKQKIALIIEILKLARTAFSPNHRYDRSTLVTALNEYSQLLNEKQVKLKNDKLVIATIPSSVKSPDPHEITDGFARISIDSTQFDQAILDEVDKSLNKIDKGQLELYEPPSDVTVQTLDEKFAEEIGLKAFVENEKAKKIAEKKAEELKKEQTLREEALKKEKEEKAQNVANILAHLEKREQEKKLTQQIHADLESTVSDLEFVEEIQLISSKQLDLDLDRPYDVEIEPLILNSEEEAEFKSFLAKESMRKILEDQEEHTRSIKEQQAEIDRNFKAGLILSALDDALRIAQKQAEKEILRHGAILSNNNVETIIGVVKSNPESYAKLAKLNDAIRKYEAIQLLRKKIQPHGITPYKNDKNNVLRLALLQKTYQDTTIPVKSEGSVIQQIPLKDILNTKVDSKVKRALKLIGRFLSKPIPKKVRKLFTGGFFNNSYQKLDKKINKALENAKKEQILPLVDQKNPNHETGDKKVA